MEMGEKKRIYIINIESYTSLLIRTLRKPVENIMLLARKIRHKMLVASINCYILAFVFCYQYIKTSCLLKLQGNADTHIAGISNKHK